MTRSVSTFLFLVLCSCIANIMAISDGTYNIYNVDQNANLDLFEGITTPGNSINGYPVSGGDASQEVG